MRYHFRACFKWAHFAPARLGRRGGRPVFDFVFLSVGRSGTPRRLLVFGGQAAVFPQIDRRVLGSNLWPVHHSSASCGAAQKQYSGNAHMTRVLGLVGRRLRICPRASLRVDLGDLDVYL